MDIQERDKLRLVLHMSVANHAQTDISFCKILGRPWRLWWFEWWWKSSIEVPSLLLFDISQSNYKILFLAISLEETNKSLLSFGTEIDILEQKKLLLVMFRSV